MQICMEITDGSPQRRAKGCHKSPASTQRSNLVSCWHFIVDIPQDFTAGCTGLSVAQTECLDCNFCLQFS